MTMAASAPISAARRVGADLGRPLRLLDGVQRRVGPGSCDEELAGRDRLTRRHQYTVTLGFRQHRELAGRAEHHVAGERRLVVAPEIGGESVGRYVVAAKRRRHRDQDALEATHTPWSPTPRAPAAAPGRRPAGRWES